MKNKAALSSLLFALAAGALFAADRGSPAEALLQRAIAHYKSVGRQQALSDFTAKKPPFGNGDLYVVCFRHDHTVVANGGFPQNVGTPGDLLKDVHGKGVAEAGWNAASTNGGVVRYRWINPVTHKLETKVAIFAKVGEDVCGVGVYNPE